MDLIRLLPSGLISGQVHARSNLSPSAQMFGAVLATQLSGLIRLQASWLQGSAAPGPKAGLIIEQTLPSLRENLTACGPMESAALLRGLAGRFIPPGASGAPTRGRPEVLPTGRNFFSIDSRGYRRQLPGGWAGPRLRRYCNATCWIAGNWPKSMVLSAWGTSNMRTGGDDLAQALALMGVQPQWDRNSRRVTGFDVIPADVLGRPRVDVSLRCSGFFRDAFPAQMSLLDRAVRAVANLDEPEDINPLAAARRENAELQRRGHDSAVARRASTMRIFSAKPGAYGAGLQTLIDEGSGTGAQILPRHFWSGPPMPTWRPARWDRCP